VTGGSVREEYDDLVATWRIRPKLAELVGIGGPAPTDVEADADPRA
jgi:hypothetical protein